MTPLEIDVLSDRYAICRLPPEAPIPPWATLRPFFSVSRSVAELSIICPEAQVPRDIAASRGWIALALHGTFDLSLVGVLASVAAPLAAARVSIMAVATYDTDYVLVRDDQLAAAREALVSAGHEVRPA